MKDSKISQPRVDKLHPLVKNLFEVFIDECERQLGITLRVVQGLRTFAEQDALYAIGRTKLKDEKGNKLKIVTKAKGGYSYHNYGLAIDVVPLIDGVPQWSYDYSKLATIADKYGIESGSRWRFKDKPHFQIIDGYTVQQLLDKHDASEVDKDGYVKL